MLFYPKKSQTWLRRQKNGIIKKKKISHLYKNLFRFKQKAGNTELCLIRIRELRWQITEVQEVVACQLSDISLILSNWIFQGNTEAPSSLQEDISFLPNCSELTWGQQHKRSCPLHALLEHLSGVRIHWFLITMAPI